MFDKTILSPAKINIGLKVFEKCKNGLHRIDSYLALIPIYDEISIQIRASGNSTAINGNDYLKDNEVDIMEKSVELYKKESGLHFSSIINIKKSIPLCYGLGGESSDAASVFKALNECFKCFNDKEALNLSFLLGSDVPFFYSGFKIAHVKGCGEKVEEVKSSFPFRYIYITKYKTKDKTSSQYNDLDKIKRDFTPLPEFAIPFNFVRFPNDFSSLFDFDCGVSTNGGYFSLSGSGGSVIYLTNEKLNVYSDETIFLAY